MNIKPYDNIDSMTNSLANHNINNTVEQVTSGSQIK